MVARYISVSPAPAPMLRSRSPTRTPESDFGSPLEPDFGSSSGSEETPIFPYISETSSINTSRASSVASRYDTPSRYDRSHQTLHDATAERKRCLKITIKASHDYDGEGMVFEVKYLDTFRNPLEHFKSACCKRCVPTKDLRFKRDGVLVLPTHTPKKLGLIHNSNTLITAFSSVPGLNCASCKAKGYPKTDKVIGPRTPVRATGSVPPVDKPEPLTLVIEDQTSLRISVKTTNTGALSFVMDHYAEKALRDVAIVRFFFDGERLRPEETPKQVSSEGYIDISLQSADIGGSWASSTATSSRRTSSKWVDEW
ncbi:SUMO protein smt3 [Elasticomyces elasticus]|nr:SUMO protein smt3 [Elasticomyces elasticus]